MRQPPRQVRRAALSRGEQAEPRLPRQHHRGMALWEAVSSLLFRPPRGL
ncbi:hypothetical protein EYF80_067838 [Liparis tanakae]|uniref:Uncharacterized protein n=1 Tax=Liparis tanakae TaxID=230148 RepID=A0A4Z2E0N6_9TELE|nr:hypothetical protein EYF80_067838 [Liparis tanakae]